MLLSTCVYKYLFEPLLSTLWGILPKYNFYYQPYNSKWLTMQCAPVLKVLSHWCSSLQCWDCFSVASWLPWGIRGSCKAGEGGRPSCLYSLLTPYFQSCQHPPSLFLQRTTLFILSRIWIHFAIFPSLTEPASWVLPGTLAQPQGPFLQGWRPQHHYYYFLLRASSKHLSVDKFSLSLFFL